MPWLEITVQGHLLVGGGQASDSSADLTTSRRYHEGHLVPYIPATALRGAVRIQLEALLRGGGLAEEVVEPYPFDGPGAAKEPSHLPGAVARLFGYSGPAARRDGAGEGAIRFGDALPVDPEQAERALRVRPGLELEDHTATAEDQKLFFREVAEISAEPLVFRAPLTVVEEPRLHETDLALLQAAAEATDAIGAGKAKGGGEVTIRWVNQESSPELTTVQGDVATATRARLLLTLLEPAHFGDGGAYGNHHATRTFIPGATVRGAVAWALLRSGKARPEDAGFQSLFLDEKSPACFGDALLVHHPQAEPAVMSATARRPRGDKADLRNILAMELARERINRTLAGDRYVQANEGTERLIPVEPARPSAGLVRTTRTRLSIDRWTGTAAAGRLFSIEQLDPALTFAGRRDPGRFVSWIEGLTPEAAQLLAKLEGLPLLVGAGRKHGLGLVGATLRFEPDPTDDFTATVHCFAASVEERTAELCRRAGVEVPGGVGEFPLALVALSDYIPSRPDIDHPLAEPELAGLDLAQPLRRFLHGGAAGGYDQRPENGAPLKDLLPAVGAGSIYVYNLAENDLDAVLDLLMPCLRRGVGRRVESGCGRFGLFEPEVAKETEMSSQPEQGLKTWMVGRAENILNEVKEDRHFRGATAQLRNLIQITQRESEVAVLENFLNYQRGRRATRDFWRLIHEQVVAALHEIEERTSGQSEPARCLAIQQFFGYLVRHYVYLDQLNEDHYRAGRAAASGGR